jgi:hypothetical protein
MLPAGSTATCGRHSKDDDMAELTRNNLDRHDWAARASQALARAKKLPPGSKRSEAIRKAEQFRYAAEMKKWLMPKPSEGNRLTPIQIYRTGLNSEIANASLCQSEANVRSALQARKPCRETARRSASCQIPSKGSEAEPASTDRRIASYAPSEQGLVGRPHGRLMAEFPEQ